MLKKGDVVSVAYRKGFDKEGSPIIDTLDRCEVQEYSGGILRVTCRVVGKSADGRDQVEIHEVTFNVNSPDFVGITPKKK